MLKKKKRRVSIVLDMTPMVDIAFLLLIFYMATTQFKPPSQKDVTLPVSSSQRDLPLKNYLTITVTDMDSVFVDVIINTKKWNPEIGDSVEVPDRTYAETTPENVGIVIQDMRVKALRQGIRDIFLVLKADRNASYGSIEKIMNAMQEEKLTSFQVVTDLDPSISRSGG
ncbi:MAG: biopolymer transporter ExbD [Candidatus Zixiibacteriota bacterium]